MAQRLNRDQIFERVVEILSDSFELEPSNIKLESTLYEDLDLDSIDAVDIFVQLRDITGRRPDPEKAKQIRTVDELVGFVESELDAAERGDPEPETQMPT
ncbi:MAG: acyl carrier protein [Sandaracinus sp.]|jgi:acyl carrier protein|nr:acyl carrier protein [Myxococcales bacterium]MCB9601868.1 acyl carrier protein [Sandaracinus sp.]MCB9611600.1 acyl carrier protein [Sandaracinus sp.]MCB9618814.1 acyl carrier protein [Sandaracinus sp.]MCB9636070.1 acyl carrier protein [Sandaracinus sp.]